MQNLKTISALVIAGAMLTTSVQAKEEINQLPEVEAGFTTNTW